MPATLNRQRQNSTDALLAISASLAEKLAALGQPAKPSLLARALHELLDGQDDVARELRTAVQIHLARVSNGPTRSVPEVGLSGEEMLSTEDAAQIMGCSRPYVAMLVDAGKLAGAVRTKGGHRKVPKAAVLQWLDVARSGKNVSSSAGDYRGVAAEVGMYSTPEEAYIEVGTSGGTGAG